MGAFSVIVKIDGSFAALEQADGGGVVPAAMVATVAWINQQLFNKPATNELCAVPPLIWSENE